MYEYQINTKINKKKLFFEIIKKFRIHIRLREVEKFIKNIVDNSTFSVSIASTSENKFKFQIFFFRNNSIKFNQCFYDQTH